MLQLDHQDVETGDGEEEPWRAVRQRRPGAKPVEAISGLFSQVSTLGNNLSRAIPGAEDRRQGARPRSRRRGLVVKAADGGGRRRGGHLGLVLQQSSSAFVNATRWLAGPRTPLGSRFMAHIVRWAAT